MTGFVPSAVVREGVLAVRLREGPTAESASFEGVADLDDFGQIIGVEILDFKSQVDGSIGESPADGIVRWSYDREIDAVYLHIANGQGNLQRTVLGIVLLDDQRRALEVKLPISAEI